VAVYLSSIALCFVEDVDLFLIAKEHLGKRSEQEYK